MLSFMKPKNPEQGENVCLDSKQRAQTHYQNGQAFLLIHNEQSRNMT